MVAAGWPHEATAAEMELSEMGAELRRRSCRPQPQPLVGAWGQPPPGLAKGLPAPTFPQTQPSGSRGTWGAGPPLHASLLGHTPAPQVPSVMESLLSTKLLVGGDSEKAREEDRGADIKEMCFPGASPEGQPPPP